MGDEDNPHELILIEAEKVENIILDKTEIKKYDFPAKEANKRFLKNNEKKQVSLQADIN